LFQTINEPTRITKTSSTLIDHHITNAIEKVVQSGVVHIGISDRSLIFVVRKTPSATKSESNTKTIEFRNLKKFDEKKFIADLHCQPWIEILLEKDTNSMLLKWKELFLNILNKHAPIQNKRLRTRQSVPWLTGDIKGLIQNRDKLKQKAISTNQEEVWEAYKSARNKVNIALRKSKTNYYRERIELQKDSPKEAWKTINSLLGRSTNNTVINELKLNDVVVKSPEKLAETLNNYFVDIGPSLSNDIDNAGVSFENYVKTPTTNLFKFSTVSNETVLKLLCGLSTSKATGLDKISSKVLKIAAPTISPSITYIINHAISSCCFPDDWKVARVIPIYKKGPRNQPENYRPISILPVISKIMERIVYNQLYSYLSDNTILCEHQYGFRRLHSTVSALLDCTNSWYMNMDRKLFNLVVFLDLKKAFDTVNHEILLRKLEMYGITGNALNLLKSYLLDRRQACQLNGFTSSYNHIKCGIPQGSISSVC